MSAPRPIRAPLWTGTQPVLGLWFDAERLPPQARALRMLAAWRPGAQALRLPAGDVLRYAQPHWCDCAGLPGEALCAVAPGVLASAPLRPEERQQAHGADLLLVRGARLRPLRLAEATVLDLSPWVALDDLALHETFDLSDTLAAAPDAAALAGQDPRQALGGKIPPPSAERDDLLQRLLAKTRGDAGIAAAHAAGGAHAVRKPLGQRLLGWLSDTALRIAGSGRGGQHSGGSGGAGQGPSVPGRAPPAQPSRWRERLTRFALSTRLSNVIGRQQGAYLRRMLTLFENGDLMEALRHALPIDADPGQSHGQAFGTPGRRSDLRLGANSGSGFVNIGTSDALQDHLRTLYRRSFAKLDRDGRIDEAAFVLGELLNARQECLDYLERHGRFAQAAELALGWDMPTAVAVRLLLLADDWPRAVQVARRDGNFGAAVALLERGHPALAQKLRLAWGEHLADRGEWLSAVDAVWPVPEARQIAEHWLKIAEDSGLELGARALVRRAQLLPDTLDAYGERLEAMIAGEAVPGIHLHRAEPATDDAIDAIDPSADNAAEIARAQAAAVRNALADALIDARKASTPALARIATALLPAVAADRGEGLNGLGRQALQHLAELGGDPYLLADLPQWTLPPPATVAEGGTLWQRQTPAQFMAPAAGLLPVFDAMPLAHGRYLLALGEAGVAVAERNGRLVQRYAVPATSLALSHSGQIALAVTRRETVSRVSRIDLVRRSSSDLGSLPLQWHAPRFDGVAWSVVADDRILVLDTGKSLQDALWSVGDLPGRIRAVRYLPSAELYLIAGSQGATRWAYSLPSRRLLSREHAHVDGGLDALLMPDGPVLQPRVGKIGDGTLHIEYQTAKGARGVSLPLDDTPTPDRIPEPIWHPVQNNLLLGTYNRTRARLGLYRTADAQPVAQIAWHGSDSALRFHDHGDDLLIFDQHGRVLHIDITRGTSVGFSVG